MHKILIIEDEQLLSDLYKIAFTKRNYEVELAVDGEDGLQKVKAGKPALILLDIMMPKMNGLQVLQHLKANPETKDIPVYIITNLTENTLEQQMRQLGALKLILKSQYLPDQIVDTVDEYFKSAQNL